MIPLVVVEGAVAQWRQIVDDVVARGWQRVPAWPKAARPGAGLIVAGRIETEADACSAVLAVTNGYGVIVHGVAERTVLDVLCDDLRHLGRLEHRLRPQLALVTDEDRELLDALLDGATLGEAALRLHLSRRTVDRRLAGLRRSWAAPSTAALLHAYRSRLAAWPEPPSPR